MPTKTKTQAGQAPKSPEDSRRCAVATGSGFAVVARHRSLGYTPVTNPTLARGYRFEEVWIFGTPSRADELDLWRAVAPIVTIMEPSTVHRIPNNEDQTTTRTISPK